MKQNVRKKNVKKMSCSALICDVKKEWFSSQYGRIALEREHDEIHPALAWGCSLVTEYLLEGARPWV